MEEIRQRQRHFVLIHGACHGAWCWYKVSTLLKSAGHKVTALDLAASGVHAKQPNDVPSLSEYYEPLMEFIISSLSPVERVILVGPSMGGLSLSAAMERFPDRISAAVFATAFMPGPHLGFITLKEEDLTLATLLTRYLPLYDNAAMQNALTVTKEKYGSVPRIYILCEQDLILSEDTQRWMIKNNPPDKVKVIAGSDHMPMFSKPQEMCSCLLEIANKYF